MKIIRQKIDVVLDALSLVFNEGPYSALAFALAIIMAITYPLIFPIVVGAKKINLLSFRGSLFDILLLTFISILFGVIWAMQLYKLRRIPRDYTKSGTNVAGTVLGFVASKACCLLPLLLLTIGATAGAIFFARHSTAIRLFGLAVLSLMLYRTSSDISKENSCSHCS